MNENTSSLTSTFRFTNENHCRISFTLSLGHDTTFYLLLTFGVFLFCIFLNVVELGWIHPSLRKEVKMIRKLLLKTFEMHTKGTFPTNVVHSEKMIDFLVIGKAWEEFWRHSRISPEYIPIIRVPILIYLIFLRLLLLLLLQVWCLNIRLRCFTSILRWRIFISGSFIFTTIFLILLIQIILLLLLLSNFGRHVFLLQV